MDRCHELAGQARESGEAPVGCVIVCGGERVGEAGEAVRGAHDPGGHAEMIALRSACQRLGRLSLADCVLYTNVEPCLMCSHAIRDCAIGTVVIEEVYEELGGVSSRHPILADASLPYPGAPPEIVWLRSGT